MRTREALSRSRKGLSRSAPMAAMDFFRNLSLTGKIVFLVALYAAKQAGHNRVALAGVQE